MKKFMKSMTAFMLIFLMTTSSVYASVQSLTTAETTSDDLKEPKYVFMMIGDGLGFSQRQITEYYMQKTTNNPNRKLAMNSLKASGINTTHSANSLITDSAAAGTALACGVKTTNGVIAQDVDGNNVKTLIEAAEEKGILTGIVSTTRLTHATPAAFASHNASRGNENDIAVDFIDSGVDFFAGGGARHFLAADTPKDKVDYAGVTMKSKRKDDIDVVKAFEQVGYTTYIGIEGNDALKAEDFSDDEKVFAALTYSHMPYEIDRQKDCPNLLSVGQMTEKAIEFLSKDGEGFFFHG